VESVHRIHSDGQGARVTGMERRRAVLPGTRDPLGLTAVPHVDWTKTPECAPYDVTSCTILRKLAAGPAASREGNVTCGDYNTVQIGIRRLRTTASR